MTVEPEIMGFIVTAIYESKIDEPREQRIHAVFKRCGIRAAEIEWTAEGTSEDDLTSHQLIFTIDEHERAVRLGSELRACGLMVSIQPEREAATS
jgi:hypothetical protein